MIRFSDYTAVVWDWNGTLLDDLRTGVQTINRMLSRREIAPITPEYYREVFGFPVKDYYERIGFDFEREDWQAISQEYVDTYEEFVSEAGLTPYVVQVLRRISEAGIPQYILSALQEDLLCDMLNRHAIYPFFRGICGADNIHAAGKTERGRQMLEKYPLIVPSSTLMIGDTLHDAEVARALGFDVLLYGEGHNSPSRLAAAGRVLTSFAELL